MTRVPGERVPLTGGFVARTAIQYFNVNVALLGSSMSGQRCRTRALDPYKTRAVSPAGWLTTPRYASLHSVGSSTATRPPATG